MKAKKTEKAKEIDNNGNHGVASIKAALRELHFNEASLKPRFKATQVRIINFETPHFIRNNPIQARARNCLGSRCFRRVLKHHPRLAELCALFVHLFMNFGVVRTKVRLHLSFTYYKSPNNWRRLKITRNSMKLTWNSLRQISTKIYYNKPDTQIARVTMVEFRQLISQPAMTQG